MSQNKQIDKIYKILPLFEATSEEDNFALRCYLSYLGRLYIQFMGRDGDEFEEICDLIKGLIRLENNVCQKEVRRIVFHMISLVQEKRGRC